MIANILIIRLGSLGDVILTSPVVLNLKIAYPGCRIVFLTKERFAEAARLIPAIDELRILPERIGARELYRLMLELDAERFDIVLDLHGNFRSWFLRTLISASRKSVYPKRRLERWQMVHRKQFPRIPWHTVDLYNSFLGEQGLPIYATRPVLLDALRKDERGTIRKNIVVIAPGAAHANKKWPTERFSELARLLNTTYGVNVAWVVTGEDAGKHNLGDLPRGALAELVDAPISTIADIMAGARLTIANDSGLAHLSSAVGTPVIALFGPTHPALGFSPRGLFDAVVEVDEWCRPCSLHGKTPCFRSERFCLNRIPVDMVAETAGQILTSPVNSRRALFVDRDGTVAVEKHYVSNPDEIELIPGAAQALRRAKEAGLALVIVSNQSGVARGLFDIDAVEHTNARLRELLLRKGVEVDLMLYCPHHRHGTVPAYTTACNCRKPSPGMPERAAIELGIDLRRSYVIGDKVADITMAALIGCPAALVRTGYGKGSEARLQLALRPDCLDICDTLTEAVDGILKRSQ
jgi:D-glycero-D-manno-heptose 1,7-bisphosphate phosphatase